MIRFCKHADGRVTFLLRTDLLVAEGVATASPVPEGAEPGWYDEQGRPVEVA